MVWGNAVIYKVAGGAIGILLIALAITAALLKDSLADEAEAKARLKDAQAANGSLVVALQASESERMKVENILHRHRQQRDELAAINRDLRGKVNAISGEAHPGDCINQRIPDELRLLLDEAGRAGHGGSVPTGGIAQPNS